MKRSVYVRLRRAAQRPRFTCAREAFTLRLAESGAINFNKNLAWGVGCMRLLGGFLTGETPLLIVRNTPYGWKFPSTPAWSFLIIIKQPHYFDCDLRRDA